MAGPQISVKGDPSIFGDLERLDGVIKDQRASVAALQKEIKAAAKSGQAVAPELEARFKKAKQYHSALTDLRDATQNREEQFTRQLDAMAKERAESGKRAMELAKTGIMAGVADAQALLSNPLLQKLSRGESITTQDLLGQASATLGSMPNPYARVAGGALKGAGMVTDLVEKGLRQGLRDISVKEEAGRGMMTPEMLAEYEKYAGRMSKIPAFMRDDKGRVVPWSTPDEMMKVRREQGDLVSQLSERQLQKAIDRRGRDNQGVAVDVNTFFDRNTFIDDKSGRTGGVATARDVKKALADAVMAERKRLKTTGLDEQQLKAIQDRVMLRFHISAPMQERLAAQLADDPAAAQWSRNETRKFHAMHRDRMYHLQFETYEQRVPPNPTD